MTRKVVVARAAPDAQKWAKSLRELGFDAHAFGAMRVRPTLDADDRAALWRQLHEARALMYVSANAVNAFWGENFSNFSGIASDSIDFVATNNIANNWPNLQHWATGPATCAALLALGVAPDQLRSPDPTPKRFDSEALWRHLQADLAHWPTDQVASTVWVIRGCDADGSVGKTWLTDQLVNASIAVKTHVVYRRELPALSPVQIKDAHASFLRGDTWVFANTQVLTHLIHSAHFSHAALGQVRVLTTHPSIASAARDLGLVRVDDGCLGHTLEDWVRTLQSGT